MGNGTRWIDERQTENLAVLAIFFDLDKGGSKPNQFFDTLNLTQINATGLNGTTVLQTSGLDLNSLVQRLDKNQGNFYHYEGSLTTPPCSQSVAWLLVNDPQPISKE